MHKRLHQHPASLILVCFVMLAKCTIFANHALADLPLRAEPPHLVVDVQTSRIIEANRAFTRWAPASLTKLMTAYTVFRALDLQHVALNSPVRVTEEALAQPPSKMGFPIGTIMTVEAALKIIMVKSANDISVALAQAVGGSEADFVALMNAHARRLGMGDSRFTNPHGLHDADQFTTARDMAILALALTREYPQHAGFFDIPAIRITGRRLRNHNRLLRLFEGTNGMKTGYVCASGYNIVVRAKRESGEHVAVVFGGKSGLARNVRAAELLTRAFASSENSQRPVLAELARPDGTSAFPVDITRTTCPRKYAASGKPAKRPADASATGKLPGIDGLDIPDREARLKDPLHAIPVPAEKPDVPKPPVRAGAALTVKEGSEGTDAATPVPEDNPPTLKERADLYLKPQGNQRKDVVVNLNGATGPNPYGILHTGGGKYKAPIPVPEKRPALDLKGTGD